MSIKIENRQVFGWEAAIRGARNPMNSWEKSDSIWIDQEYGDYNTILGNQGPFHYDDDEEMAKYFGVDDFVLSGMYVGPNDHKLLMNLCKGGTEESKWRRMVHVQMDITAPLYWWKEFETYKIGTVCNSCSTMHKIQAKEFTLEDFSCEHLSWGPEHDGTETFISEKNGPSYYIYPKAVMKDLIDVLNHNRKMFLETNDKKYWWQMIQLLPSSYNQRRTIDLNYEVLAKQYRERKNHKLQEWRSYCEWMILELPYSEFITMEGNND